MTGMKRRFSAKTIVQLSISAFFVFAVIFPIVSMLCNITTDGLVSVVTSAQFSSAICNSVTTGLTATAISLGLAMMAAWCLERTSMKLKALFGTCFLLPMLLPSISHAFGLVALMGKNGLVTNLLGLDISIYGFWGIVAGAVMYSFPVAFLMFESILHYEDALPYEAAKVLGIPRFRQFLNITLPYLKKPIISAFFAVFTMVITDYGVPLMIGGKTTTLSVLMYNKAVAMIDYDAGSVIGAILLVPAIAAFLVDLLNPEHNQGGFVSKPIVPETSGTVNVASYAFCAIMLTCIVAPVASFCVMVFETTYPIDPTFTLYHIQKTMNRGAGEYLLNSMLYSVLAASFGSVLAFFCAYMTTRMQGVFGKVLHLISMTSMAIPGIVLGLSYLLFFNDSPIYGTILIVVLVNSIHFFASPYMMMHNTLEKLNPNLEAVGTSLGISRLHIIVDVILPKVWLTLCEMFIYFFVNSLMTISAVSFLAPPAPKPLALMINQFEAQRLMESAAFVSLIILIINLLVKLLMQLIKKFGSNEVNA